MPACNVQNEIKELGVSQARLAQLFGVSTRTVERWCALGMLPSWALQMIRIMRFLPGAKEMIENAVDAKSR